MQVDGVEREDHGVAQVCQALHVGQRRQATLAVHHVGLVCAEEVGAGGGAHGVEVHDQVGGRGRVDDLAGLGELEDLLEGLGQIGLRDLVGTGERDGRGRVDGKGTLEAVEVVALERLAHGVGLLVGEEVLGKMLVERQQHVVLGGKAGPGVVDHEEVVLGGELLDGLALELGERALLPGDIKFGVQLGVPLRDSHDGGVAPAVVPRDASQFH